MKITVRTPASTANLGPGFDCLGLALDLWAVVTVDTSHNGGRAEGAARLVDQGINAAFDGVGKPPPLSIEWDGALPLARGLGASASLRAAGLLAGNALLDNVHDIEMLLALGTRLEGFPDNMSASLLGGLQVLVQGEAGLITSAGAAAAGPGHRRLRARLRDADAGGAAAHRQDAVHPPGRRLQLRTHRAAGGVAGAGALRPAARGDAGPLPPARARPDLPGLAPIMAAAVDAGAAASYLSGGGSTVAAFVQGEGGERVARLMTQAAIANGYSGRSLITRASDRGAYIVE